MKIAISKIAGINDMVLIGSVSEVLVALKRLKCKSCFDGCHSCVYDCVCPDCNDEGYTEDEDGEYMCECNPNYKDGADEYDNNRQEEMTR